MANERMQPDTITAAVNKGAVDGTTREAPSENRPPGSATSSMRVTKRDGSSEAVDVTKIVRAVERCCAGLADVDALRVATRTISGLYDGATTRELDELSIRTAASLIAEEPEYSRLAARLLATYIDKEVEGQDVHAFSQSVRLSHELGVIGDRTAELVQRSRRKLDDAIDPSRSNGFEYFGLRTVYDRYLLRHPDSRLVLETPQYFFLRVACGLSDTATEAIELHRLMSSLAYLPSSPTLFNAGTRHEQMSSCYLLDSPEDDLEAIYHRYTDVAKLSKFAGGIGLAYHRIRARGSLIRGTNGRSNGIIPFLKTLDSSVAAVNQGGRRKGAACVYLEPWHADVEQFVELRDNTGDDARRTHNINIANWVPDLFMRRVAEGGDWSLFDPKDVPELPDLWGEEFDRAYELAEAAGLAVRTVPARDLYARMMRTLAQTGNGWMAFKDAANAKSNQTKLPGRVIHLSNLCTEILEVTSRDETAVCNLGSINLTAFVVDGVIDYAGLADTVRTAVTFLDRVIDRNYYPIGDAARSNAHWRPIGLGVMGLADLFFELGLAFDSDEARALARNLAEEIYFQALLTSCDLAQRYGRHPGFAETRAADGVLQPDLWEAEVSDPARWAELRDRIRQEGLRNSLVVAIAPTATIASIAGCSECIEPPVSNVFKRETLSGEFLQVNRHLVRELKALGSWTEEVRTALKRDGGSVQAIPGLPEELRRRYRTAWEIPQRSLIDMAADRGPFVDQSQSLNLFMEQPAIGRLSSMYRYAWERGLKTTYYLRSRPATRIMQTTVGGTAAEEVSAPDAAVCSVACSLENPEACEACQ
jgi:ribonucleoside-diphosphate reductase alpha chain